MPFESLPWYACHTCRCSVVISQVPCCSHQGLFVSLFSMWWICFSLFYLYHLYLLRVIQFHFHDAKHNSVSFHGTLTEKIPLNQAEETLKRTKSPFNRKKSAEPDSEVKTFRHPGWGLEDRNKDDATSNKQMLYLWRTCCSVAEQMDQI